MEQLAQRMYQGILSQEEAVLYEINNYHKDYLGMPIKSLRDLQLGKEVAYMTIAHEFGFSSWESVEKLDAKYDPAFEKALGFLLAGSVKKLKGLLHEYPHLLSESSIYGHEATLLHYTASNGVELWRQQVPNNIVDIAGLLLLAGASKHAFMNVYGGEFTAYALAESSAHPYDAGLAPELFAVLK
ncbi:MAG: hypothetical protein KJO04_04245 [Bacteroidia bacterium]|nr:hypothetical protein [Bacteroidia bacterium]